MVPGPASSSGQVMISYLVNMVTKIAYKVNDALTLCKNYEANEDYTTRFNSLCNNIQPRVNVDAV